MGRTRPIKPGTRQYGTKTRYSDETLKKIVDDITAGRIGQREASKKYNIPRQTIVNKLKNKHSGKVGRPTVFTELEEKIFVKHCITVSDMGIPISLYDLRCIVKSYLDSLKRNVSCFPGNMPGWEWGKSFIERNISELSQKFAVNISRKRAVVNEEIVDKFFENYKKEVEGIPPQNIFNFDETGFHDIPSKGKLLFRRSCRHPEKIENSSKSCFTVMFCGNASGEFLPPYIIFKGKQKWTDWIYNAPPGSRLNASDSGWMEQGIFDDWFQHHFLPFALKKEGRRVIIGDNLTSHISLKTLQLCEENDISFICLPPNATHILQPLDVAYFSSLKKNWRDILSQWRKTPEGKKKQCLPKGVFSGLLAKALNKGEQTASSNIIKGFEKCGLYPVNCDRVAQCLPGYARDESSVVDSVGREFHSYLETIRTSDLKVKEVKKYRLPIEPGKSISTEDVRTFYEERELSISKKKRTIEGNENEEKRDELEFVQPSTKRPRSGPKTRGGVRARGATVRILKNIGQNDAENNILAEIDVNSCMPESSELVNCPIIIAEENKVLEQGILLDMFNKPSTDENSYSFEVNDYVVVAYEGKCYPGKVTAIEVRGNFTAFRVSCMVKKGKNWVWPEREDEIWYNKDSLLKKIQESSMKKINKRGMVHIRDNLLSSSDEDD